MIQRTQAVWSDEFIAIRQRGFGIDYDAVRLWAMKPRWLAETAWVGSTMQACPIIRCMWIEVDGWLDNLYVFANMLRYGI
jgi:hypothetical protein